MREIKFRAFHEPTKQMFDVFSFDVNNVRAWYPEKYGLEISPDREDCILMQYTGLKDNNGKEIYEGDIVKINRKLLEDTFSGELQFGYFLHSKCDEYKCEHYGWYIVLPHPDGYDTGFDIGFAINDNYAETMVIGNIYENPELLEVGK